MRGATGPGRLALLDRNRIACVTAHDIIFRLNQIDDFVPTYLARQSDVSQDNAAAIEAVNAKLDTVIEKLG